MKQIFTQLGLSPLQGSRQPRSRFWADSPSIQHDRVAPAGVLDSDVIPEGVQYVLATDGLSVVVNIQEVITRYGCVLLYLSFQP